MKKAISLTIIFLLFSLLVLAQDDNTRYSIYWRKVHKHELLDLSKSASAVVDSIYMLAKEENNNPQRIKALIYQSKFALTLEEDAQLKIINRFKEEIDNANAPAKNILESILANLYWQYYQQNRWRIYNRTATEEKVDSEDFRSWDLKTLIAEIHHHYQNSLRNEAITQQTPLKHYSEILTLEEDAEIFTPTLFDFLARHALNFYKTTETNIPRPAYKFQINDPLYFKNLKAVSIETRDSLSLQFHALKLYQQLLQLHENKQNTEAFVNAEIESLNFIAQNGTYDEKRQLLLDAFFSLKNRYRDNPVSTLADFEIASVYQDQASGYSAKENEEYRFKKREALQICKEAIEKFPKSIGAQKCMALRDNILRKELSVTTEKHIPVDTYSRLLVEYQNIDTLYFRIYNVQKNEEEDFHTLPNDSARAAFFNSLTAEHEWSNVLRNEHDYQSHQTEILVPELPGGIYLIYSSPSPELASSKDMYAYAFMQVTDLAMIEQSASGNTIYQVVDRNNGKPLRSAKIHLFSDRSEGYYDRIDQHFVTDDKGQFIFSGKGSFGNVEATVTYGNDKAYFGDYWLYNPRRNRDKDVDEEVVLKSFLFTDRSIYRPGQTVYFKGILIKKEGAKSDVVAGEYVEVYMEDVNGQELELQRIKTNEYGSFSGKFILPATGLTGEYTIYVEEDYEEDSKLYDEIMDDFEWSEHTISVEEYKRPRFEAEFKPVTETYRINDSITVDGAALAYAGSNITDARVSYRVHRKVQYPHWYHWHKRHPSYYAEPQEIAQGETHTNNKGEFSITFKAIPDQNVSMKHMPVFNYEITADITDVNGETRNATTIVKVGYHSMVATINAPEQFNKNETDNTLSITTKNLNGEPVAAKGTINVYKINLLDNVKRKRPWPAPDYQEFTESEFNALFPHDPYEDEENFENPDYGEEVFSMLFDTEVSGEIELDGMKTWHPGSYIIQLTSTDDFGQEVTDKHTFNLADPKTKEVADNQLFIFCLDKPYYNVGDNINLTIGSASPDLTVTIDIESKHRIVKTYRIHLNNTSKTLKIPIDKKDFDGFAIHYRFVNFNYFENGIENIVVQDETNSLSLETISFRDRIQPGATETWSFKIKGSKKDKALAEVLAGMYDFSLDQFKPHQWNFNPVQTNRYYSYNPSNARQSFGTKSFSIRNQRRYYHRPAQQRYTKLNWFGFSFNNNRYSNRQYLQKIAYDLTISKVDSSTDKSRKSGFIHGTVMDEEGNALPGVNVVIKGSDKGVVTDINGEYSIKASEGDELVFAFVGMSSTSAVVGKYNIIDVIMVADVQELSEVVILGYGEAKRSSLTSSVVEVADEEIVEEELLDLKISGNIPGVEIAREKDILIRGNASPGLNNALYIIDGVPVENFEFSKEDVLSLEVLKGAEATALYGARGANGVIIISTKVGQAKLDAELAQVKARKNLQETAFFFPHLSTNKKGVVSFNFTAPEALTRWKLQLLAHTKSLISGQKTLTSVTQKELMVIPNAPRFLREGDEIVISSKITNLTPRELKGFASLQLFDALTGEPVDNHFNNLVKNKEFTVASNGNTSIAWNLRIPDNVEAVQYKVVAKAGDFSDGEQNIMPILTNRILVTETLPMTIRSNETKNFILDKLKKNNSTTLKHQKLTLEMISNPAWYAVLALPYLMEYPHECSEQIFSRYYANALASHIVNSNPRIKEVFAQWSSAEALISNLEKNTELKSIIIQETPWLRDAQSEAAQQKSIAMLFELNKLENELQASINKLEQMQMNNGGFPWFQGNNFPNRYISQHIASGYGHLKHLKVNLDHEGHQDIIKNLVQFLDKEIINDHSKILKQAQFIREEESNSAAGLKKEEEYLEQKHLTPTQIQYLYMRSFYDDISIPKEAETAITYYHEQSAAYWKEFTLYMKGMIALNLYRSDNDSIPPIILRSLEENSITNEEMGMYWKENKPSWYWHEAHIETQALLIEAFSEIGHLVFSDKEKGKIVDELKIWLLKNKQTQQWSSTKATTEATYALLLNGTDWISTTDKVDINIGTQKIDPDETKPEAGSGYFKTSWNGNEITNDMGDIEISKQGEGISWGGLYWQYFEDLEKITTAETPLQLGKKLFLKQTTEAGEQLIQIDSSSALQVGDLIRVRIELNADRDMDFIHMKDMRAAGLEPVTVLSEYKWQDGLGYYESTLDASTNFFFDHLRKGIYVFEYDLRVNNSGDFSNGITIIQSMYAPEFSSQSEGARVVIKE